LQKRDACCWKAIREERQALLTSVNSEVEINNARREEKLMQLIAEMYDNIDRVKESPDMLNMLCDLQHRIKEVALNLGWVIDPIDRDQYSRPGIKSESTKKVLLQPRKRGIYLKG
jgi:hypothetical protein